MEKHFGTNTCQECGKTLVGRVDKKFCDTDCRAAFHNRHKSLGEVIIRKYNSILRQNRRILLTLCHHGKSTVRREVLEQMGYRFQFYTNTYQSSKGGIYYLCYDYGFTPILENSTPKALIVQRQEYMDKYVLDPWTTFPV